MEAFDIITAHLSSFKDSQTVLALELLMFVVMVIRESLTCSTNSTVKGIRTFSTISSRSGRPKRD